MKKTVLSLFALAFMAVGTMIQPLDLGAVTVPDQMTANNQETQDTLWLARVLYSETNRPEEQVMIAWAVRNRVDTGFRGSNYKEVALSEGQFSGLNSFDKKYAYNISRTFNQDDNAEWKKAVEIAQAVYHADDSQRPFTQTIRHFYSPGVAGTPAWIQGQSPALTLKDARSGRIRFAFYDGIK